MNIVQQVEEAHDHLTGPGQDELAWVLGHDKTPAGQPDTVSRLVAAVAAMRLAMDDPSCVDQLEPGTERRGNTMLAGTNLHHDPVATAAIAKNTARLQHQALITAIGDCHRSALAGKVRHATGKAYTIASAVVRWLPRQPTQKERMQAARDLEPGCVSCARTEVVRGTKRWEMAVRPGTLCDWCYRWKLRTGEAPSVDVVEQHHRGRVRVSA